MRERDPRRRRDHERRRHPRRQGLCAGHRHHPPRRAGGTAVRQSSRGARRQGQRICARRSRTACRGCRAAAGRFPQVSGMTVEFDPQRPAGSRVLVDHGRRRAARSGQDLPGRRPTISWRAAATAMSAFAAVDPLVPLEDTPLLSNEVMIYLRERRQRATAASKAASPRNEKRRRAGCAAAALRSRSPISGRRAAPGRRCRRRRSAGLALHAERLQRDGVARAADQRIGADADADRGARRAAAVIAGEIAAARAAGRREHRPRPRRPAG